MTLTRKSTLARPRRFFAAAFCLLAAACPLSASRASAQGFPNVQRTPGELLAGPIAPEQGRTAIVAWHGERIVSVPEPPGSQPGADVLMRVVDISDLANPQVTTLPTNAGGFNSHGYFKYGPYLFVGNHCLTEGLAPCGPGEFNYENSLVIGGAGTQIGGSSLARGSIEDAGLPLGGINRSGAQSPWAAEQWWSYDNVQGDGFLAVRRSLNEIIYDWANGGALTGDAITATWDHLGDTGVIGFPFIMGDLLIYASDQTGTGVAAYDISDLSNPVLLDVLKEENPGGYWPEIYGHYIFFPRRDNEGGPGSDAGFMVVDFSDPTDLRVVADRNLEGSNQYVTFQDEYAFMNRYKIDMRTFEVVLELETVPGVIDASQFALPVGNLLVTGGYGTDGPGLAVWAHQAEPDARAPFVAYHVPQADRTNYSTQCPITLSIPETLRTETIVDGESLIVRPLGGDPVATWHSFGQGKLLTVTPQVPLQPDTTYEVVLTSAIQDAAGNGLEPYSFRFSTGGGLSGGNEPPSVDAIQALPAPAAPGEMVAVSWAGSDPEGGPVEYRLDFGDGSDRTPWGPDTSASHVYAEAGHWQLTLQARDGLGSVSARSRTITVVALPAAPGSTASGLLALDEAARRLYVANPDADTVSALDSSAMGKLWEAPVGGHPKSVALAADGTVWAACRDSDTIDVLDPATGERLARLDLPYGSAPVALAPAPSGMELLVSCEGDGTLRRFSAATRTETGSLFLGPSPRAIAITEDGARALVTRFISGEHAGQVYDVDLSGPDMALARAIPLTRDRSADGSASSRGVPNYLASVRIAPDGRWAWVVGKKDNTNRGTFFGEMMVPGQDNTVRAQLMLIDLEANAEDVSLRLDIDNSDSPSAIAFSPLGDYAFVALQGNAQVAVVDALDLMRQDSPGTVHSRWGTGLAPRGLAVDAAAGRVFSGDFMARGVTALEAGNFLATGSANVPSSATPVVAEERLQDSVLLGKGIFYHASDPRMSAEGYISCATCHVGGGHDGRTFDFTSRGEGFRNTTDLRGRSGMGHGAVHWSANFDEIQDFENDIRGEFGGTGFMADEDFAASSESLGAPKAGRSADLDALAAYVTSLGPASIPRSPFRAFDRSLTEAAVRGRDVFAANGCGSCHDPAADFTDRTRHDAGTLKASSGGRLGGTLDGIDTPTLLGVHATAPYFHDGSAATLEEVFSLTGGRLAQAEDGAVSGGAVAEDISWLPLKEWHNSEFVTFNSAGALTFADVETSLAGPGYVEMRYNASYGQGQARVSVNGAETLALFPQSPNEPSWQPNEWRRLRVPVDFQAGANTVSILGGENGGQLRIDDILFSTPDDAAAASAHVRGFAPGELDDLVAYLLSLDGTDAARPDVAIFREAPIPLGGTDAAEAPDAPEELVLVYSIENAGPGPLNLGRFYIDAQPEGDIWIASQPAAHVLAGESATLEIRALLTGESATATVRGWSDAPGAPSVSWTVEAARSGEPGGGSFWVAY